MKNLARSLAMQDKAKALIPGMTQLLSKRPDLYSLGVWPGYYSEAKGARITDLDGNTYLDMSIAGIGANVLGYADEDVDAAVLEAVRKGSSSSLNCPEEVELAEVLVDLHPWADMARFARTGGEAMAVAVRIARAHTGRDVVAFCGYHGWHDWYLAANLAEKNALGEHLIPGLSPVGVPRGLTGTAHPFRYNHPEELEAIVAEHGSALAAVVMEPLRNFEPAPGFMERVRELADETGAVLVMDEISAGFRLNTGGAHLVSHSVAPDMAVFSKALGNGYPIAALIGRAEVMQSAQTSFISSTNWTERIGPAAALAMIAKHKRLDAGSHLTALGKAVQSGWKDRAGKAGLLIETGGMYPMSHFDIQVDDPQAASAYFVQLMLEKGFLASTAYYAMHAHTFEHVEAYLDAAEDAFGEIARATAEGGVRNRLLGKPAISGFKRLT